MLFLSLPAGDYELRRFSPFREVDLCGHATPAAAHVIFNIPGFPELEIVFSTRSANLLASRREGMLQMDIPMRKEGDVDDYVN